MKKIKVAVIGFGHLGKWHVEKVLAHFAFAELVLIAENFEKNKLEAKNKYPQIKIVDDISSHLFEFDAAIIVTPTSTHFEIAKFLIENNKHVFCEKPLTENPVVSVSDGINAVKLIEKVRESLIKEVEVFI